MATNTIPKVLITNADGVHEVGIRLLRKFCDVIINDGCTQESILFKAKGVDAVLTVEPANITKELLKAAGPQLKFIAFTTSSIQAADIQELSRQGVSWSTLTDEHYSTVADFAVMLLLAASRRLYEARLIIERSQWKIGDLQWMLGQPLVESTVGLVGLGGIGQKIIKRLSGFRIKNYLYNAPEEEEGGERLGAQYVSLDTLLVRSDFVIISCPLTNKTKKMCNAQFFSKMKTTSVFVNISSGGIVDEPALIQALKNGDIFAAGLDVMTPEPLPADHELLQLPNVVLAPHIASKTVDTARKTSLHCALNILNGLNLL